MICPNCNYEHGFNVDKCDNVEGEYDEFYKLPVKLERRTKWWDNESVSLYACPACMKTFVE
jgi:protein-arginine kinase activator protein McsA